MSQGKRQEYLWQHGGFFPRACIDFGRVHMKDGMVKVGVRIAAGSRPKKPLPLFASQESDVLHQVRHPLLIWLFIHTP
jgi:hypothetical protein